MVDPDSTQGERIRGLFRNASNATIIAPFIKVDALRSVLGAIPRDTPVRCVTRWLPMEVAAGVSDPEILNVLYERGSSELLLADRLHAKLYIADDRCLVGSANVTLAALGDIADRGNIEVLVDVPVDDPGVVATLFTIDDEAKLATELMAASIRRLADALPRTSQLAHADVWYPLSRHADRAYRIYNDNNSGYLTAADQILLADVARSNVRPGLSEPEFRSLIRDLLAQMPIAAEILDATEDKLLTHADARPYLDALTTERFGSQDLWRSFVYWMAFFYDDMVMKQDITEIALRRARLLSDS